jgi:hypothetical protein
MQLKGISRQRVDGSGIWPGVEDRIWSGVTRAGGPQAVSLRLFLWVCGGQSGALRLGTAHITHKTLLCFFTPLDWGRGPRTKTPAPIESRSTVRSTNNHAFRFRVLLTTTSQGKVPSDAQNPHTDCSDPIRAALRRVVVPRSPALGRSGNWLAVRQIWVARALFFFGFVVGIALLRPVVPVGSFLAPSWLHAKREEVRKRLACSK